MRRRLTISARRPTAAYSQIAVFKTGGTFYKGFSLNHVSHQCGHHPMTFTLPTLPYAYDALAPHMSKETLEYHHDKHHQAYVNNLNAALDKHPELHSKSVEDLLRSINTVPEDIRTAIRNNAGGHSNHSIFWSIMGPGGGGNRPPRASASFAASAPATNSVTK